MRVSGGEGQRHLKKKIFLSFLKNIRNLKKTQQQTTKMPPKITDNQIFQITTLIDLQTPVKTIGALVIPPVSYTTVLKVRQNIKSFGQPRTPRLVQQGRPRKLTTAMEEVSKYNLFIPIFKLISKL